MSIENWHPPANLSETPFDIDHDVLTQFVRVVRNGGLADLRKQLPEHYQKTQYPLMKLPMQKWIEAVEGLSNEEILDLVRFFTIAEEVLDNWQAGADSPVIGLVKALRKRKSPPDKELLLWIKANSSNRFIPNGAL